MTLTNAQMLKLIKKPQLAHLQQQQQQQQQLVEATMNENIEHNNNNNNNNTNTNVFTFATGTTATTTTTAALSLVSSLAAAGTINTKPIITSNIQLTAPQLPLLQQQPSTSLIKSLLANKVTQRQQKQKDIVTQANIINQQQQQQQSIKVTSNTISALVNNPLMQNTSVKVGQTTIKPLNPQLTLEKKHMMMETSSAPPPLAPLSGHNVAIKDNGRSVILSNQMLADILDKKPGEPPIPTTTIIKRKLDEGNLSGLISDSPNIKRLAYDANGSVIAIVSNNNNNNCNTHPNSREEIANIVTPSKNAANFYAEMAASILEDEDLEDIPTLLTHGSTQPSTSSSTPAAVVAMQTAVPNINNDANVTVNQKPQQSIMLPTKMQQNSVSMPMQRQILFQTATTNQAGQLKLTTSTGQPTTMATIKTEQGLQTLPVILQQKPMDSAPPQLVLQQQQTPHTTQYVLATNQQGQTYLVAQQTTSPAIAPQQQTQQPTQTVLVTQTPQQQSTGTKTIIILQQQALPSGQGGAQTQLGGGQKMIMTTAQGQSLLVTQRSAPTPVSTPTPPPQSPIIINPGTGLTSNMLHRQLQLQQQQQQHQQQPQHHHHLTQPAAGQISPTLLSQLNHIPATIKLHQPSVITSNVGNTLSVGGSTATITRVTKPMTMLHQQQQQHHQQQQQHHHQQQQHGSIIQQHLLSGGSEKRQVILTSGGRAIEIKETIIQQHQTQQQQQQLHSQQQQLAHIPTSMGVQSALLNSQTIITHSPRPIMEAATPPPPTIPTPPLAATSVAATTPTQQITPLIQQQQQQQKISKMCIIPSLPTVNVPIQPKPATSMPITATTTAPSNAQILMTGKKTSVIARSPSQNITGVIKTSTSLTSNTGIDMGCGPPPLAMPSSVSQEIQHQQQQYQKNDDLSKLPSSPNTPTTTPTPPLRTPTPTTITMSSVLGATATTTTTPSSGALATATPHNNVSTAAAAAIATTTTTVTPSVATPTIVTPVDVNWLYICDWRNCARRKFKSLNDLQHHVCSVHCPDHLDPAAEIFCQWGAGPNLCDGIPRKRFSLMTHLIDRHITVESLRQSLQKRITSNTNNIQSSSQQPVTIIRNMNDVQRASSASPSSSSSSSTTLPAMGSSALQAIKRHTADFMNSKDLMDENEGPVTKSIRLTAALILRNLVTYTNSAKRSLRRYEPHLSNIALSNVESSGTVSHILFELNN